MSGLESPDNVNELFDRALPLHISGDDIMTHLDQGIQEVAMRAPGLDLKPIYEQLNNASPDKWLESFLKPFFIELAPQFKVPNAAQNFRKGLENKVGILSLTARNNHLSMWAYYAADGRGFVLEFNDKGHLFDNSKSQVQCLRKIAKVTYQDTRPEISPLAALLPTQEWIEELAVKVFLTKSTGWAHEEELRVVKGLTECTPLSEGSDIYLYSFNAEEISSIYLGAKVDTLLEQEVMKLLKQPRYRHVNLYKSVLSERHYGLEFINVNPEEEISK